MSGQLGHLPRSVAGNAIDVRTASIGICRHSPT